MKSGAKYHPFVGPAVFTTLVLSHTSCSNTANPITEPTAQTKQSASAGTAGLTQTASAAGGVGGGQSSSGPQATSTAGRAANISAPTAGTQPEPDRPTTPKPQAGAGAPAAAGGSAVANAGTGGAVGSAGASGAAEPSKPDVACDPANKTADPKPVQFAKPGEGPGIGTPTGEFKPIMEADPGIPTHTIIRPDPLGKIKHPILAWGEGGCGKSGNIGMFTNLFMEFASHGILIVADGPPTAGGPTMPGSDAKPLLYAIDWARKENERPCSQYYHKLDVTKVAVSGQSCGGLMAIQAATDPKITTAFPFNSGLFSRDQAIYNALHAPMAIFDGGKDDIAYANGLADFNAISKIPILFGNPTSCSSNAHVCTFFDANAGEYGRAGVAWMRWHLLGDQGATGKGMFIGDMCGLCGPAWTLQWKNAPM